MSEIMDNPPLVVAFLLVIGLVVRAWRKKKEEKEIVPASPGLRPEEAERPALPAGYVESPRTYELRAAFVVRHATAQEIREAESKAAIRELMQNVGRN